jgi:hypothetical protein
MQNKESSETNTKLLYAVPEAAGLLSMGTRTLWSFVKAGEIQSRRVGRRIYITQVALQKFTQRDHAAPNSKTRCRIAGEIPASGEGKTPRGSR